MRHQFLSLAVLLTIAIALQSTNAQNKDAKMTDTKSDKSAQEVMVIETTMGTIEVALFRAEAPKTVENFVQLAAKKYYDGIIFHRVIDNFMIQGGDPTGTGTAGESIYGKKFEDEISPKLKFDRPGLLAMANAGPNTNGSQFFITTVPTPWLTGKHTIFGEVVSGMDIVNAIGKVPASKGNNKPLKDVVMKSVHLKGAKKAADEKPAEDKKK
jgi:cyclophilin family peptidyl-prolyl cis-trans isomerase